MRRSSLCSFPPLFCAFSWFFPLIFFVRGFPNAQYAFSIPVLLPDCCRLFFLALRFIKCDSGRFTLLPFLSRYIVEFFRWCVNNSWCAILILRPDCSSIPCPCCSFFRLLRVVDLHSMISFYAYQTYDSIFVHWSVVFSVPMSLSPSVYLMACHPYWWINIPCLVCFFRAIPPVSCGSILQKFNVACNFECSPVVCFMLRSALMITPPYIPCWCFVVVSMRACFSSLLLFQSAASVLFLLAFFVLCLMPVVFRSISTLLVYGLISISMPWMLKQIWCFLDRSRLRQT